MRENGLEPIVAGAALAADSLDNLIGKHDKEIDLIEELATQCSRALRNLSVNRKFRITTGSELHFYSMRFFYSDKQDGNNETRN